MSATAGASNASSEGKSRRDAEQALDALEVVVRAVAART